MTKVILLFSPLRMVATRRARHDGSMFSHYTPAHIVNILCHIVGGTTAILAGLVAIWAGLRGRLHSRAGMTFVCAYSLVILTAALGVIVFEFRSFLAVATLASSYSLFSGFRATRLRGARPAMLDRAVALLGLAVPIAFIVMLKVLKTPWAPVLTWTVLGSMISISSYDLRRSIMSATWLHKTWVHEHVFKIVGAFDALTATFAATIFPQFQPWSAVIPHAMGMVVIVTFFLTGPRLWGGRQKPRALTFGKDTGGKGHGLSADLQLPVEIVGPVQH